MSTPGLSEENAKDPLVEFLEELPAQSLGQDWDSEYMAAAIRTKFYVKDLADHNFEMACIHNFQQDLKQQVRDEIAVENGTYVERD